MKFYLSMYCIPVAYPSFVEPRVVRNISITTIAISMICANADHQYNNNNEFYPRFEIPDWAVYFKTHKAFTHGGHMGVMGLES
ncbi:Uncharacterized protein APZ42_015103 [Daphnia magna]|uniref:Uncharacterized protein n=2 Tax=Daphnia magna TaxID=35525 RepID=A0A162P5S5_9CRUS|nr:Uncharacterized protein APZ42_015103 [Daphnia magna]